MGDFMFKPKDSNEPWRKLEVINATELRVEDTELERFNTNIHPVSFSMECEFQPTPMMRLVMERMKQYYEEAERIVKPLQERCKKCSRVSLLVDKEKKEIIRPMCKENCPHYILTQQSLNELYERYSKIINPQTERKQND